MAGEINVPLLGRTPRGAVIAGGLAVVGVGGYLLYKHFTKPKTPVPAKGTPYSYGYGHAYGYGTYGGYGTFGYGGWPGGFPWPSGYGPQTPTSPYGGPPTTNAQWFTDATAALGSSGTDHIGAVLASYLAGTGIAKSDAIIVQEAIGFVGPVPVPGPDGFPPKIRYKSGNGGNGGNAVNPVKNLKVIKPGTTGVDVGWDASKGATSYQVTSTKGNPGMIGPTSARIHDIGRNSSATVSVLAEPAASDATPATLTVKTSSGRG